MPDGFTQPHSPAHVRVRSALTNRIEGEMKMCLGTMIVQVRCLLPFGPRALPRSGEFFFCHQDGEYSSFPCNFSPPAPKKTRVVSTQHLGLPLTWHEFAVSSLTTHMESVCTLIGRRGQRPTMGMGSRSFAKSYTTQTTSGLESPTSTTVTQYLCNSNTPTIHECTHATQLDACKVCSQPKTI